MLIPSAKSNYEDLLSNSYSVFFGAGLSIHSGLPSAFSLISTIVNRLPFDSIEKKDLLTSLLERLPFEAFIEILDQYSDIDPLLNIFEGATPNDNHRFLAKLLVTGRTKTLCTTNFDDLLENAIKEEGWEQDKDYLLISDLRSFNSVNWDSSIPKVIKIHGSINNREEMAITLRQVASHQVFEPRKKAIEYLFNSGSHSHVLVAGYSCSDIFDISPQIESLSSKKTIFFVEHDTKSNSIEELGNKKNKNPFRKYKGIRLLANTDMVVSDLAVMSGAEFGKDKSKLDSSSALECVQSWVELFDAQSRQAYLNGICASLYKSLSMYQNALKYYYRALDSFDNPLLQGRVLADAATSQYHLGDYESAIKFNLASLKISRVTVDKESGAGCLGSLSQIYLEKGELDRAVQNGHESLESYKSIEDYKGQARQHGTLGSIYCHRGELDKSEYPS